MILKKIKSFFNNTALMALVLSLLLYITMVIFRPTALSLNSIATIFSTASMLIFVCAGQMIVITSGDGIDLSAGAMMSTTACITVELMKGDNEKLLPTILVCMAFGFFIGILNGLGVTYIGIPALIMTLCMSTVLTKLQIVISNGAPRGTVSKELSSSLTTRFFGVIPGIMIWAFLFFLVVVLFLKYTKFGHRLNLIGTNFEAANLSGIRAKRVRMLAYGLGGMMAGIGGLVGAGYFRQMQVSTFNSYTMQSISAVVIGGTMLSGGKANYLGTVFGALLLTVLSQFLSSINTSVAMRNVIMGVMLIILLIAYNRKPAVRQ
ncbi:ABC transporter permease [Flexilinea flocculi]|jgi:ribose transport system permease protein|uniref:Ribose/xylose/arabinose/galactoside ABC-type transport system, permease component n=1 Tax=Flexilinea flocculi TaxID=1678840 RepID=A0A0K8PCM5_9CHLR|nr:ABC transporter permease [Flexilinea flocculi]GAP39895.1 ribose/xylose/arabinose/galactoside ABC-type transport system, permease component [Flexilinea flocculi]